MCFVSEYPSDNGDDEEYKNLSLGESEEEYNGFPSEDSEDEKYEEIIFEESSDD